MGRRRVALEETLLEKGWNLAWDLLDILVTARYIDALVDILATWSTTSAEGDIADASWNGVWVQVGKPFPCCREFLLIDVRAWTFGAVVSQNRWMYPRRDSAR